MDTDRTLPRRIHGRHFLEALMGAGVISPGSYVRRIVIDASIDSAVKVYIERIGDERILDVAPLLTGLNVRTVVREEAEPAG